MQGAPESARGRLKLLFRDWMEVHHTNNHADNNILKLRTRLSMARITKDIHVTISGSRLIWDVSLCWGVRQALGLGTKTDLQKRTDLSLFLFATF